MRHIPIIGFAALLSSCISTAPVIDRLELPEIESKDIIVEYMGFTVSYDAVNRIPEWVAYELTDEETTGAAEREGMRFDPDPDLEIRQAEFKDYSHSGWTRGHMAPAADFKWDHDAMAETFYMTNICPQNEENNKDSWNNLEIKVREWAKEYGKVYVVSGPIIGDNINGKIGRNKVTVPDAFFKAVLREDGNGWKSAAYIMENSAISQSLNDCIVSVNELEEITGLDFFHLLPDEVEETIESERKYKDWR